MTEDSLRMIRATPILLALALNATAIDGLCEERPDWRVYGTADGLPENACRYVSIGGAGDVLVETLNTKEIARFDGYSWTNVPGATPTDAIGRVYESPAGQLWMASAKGLCEWVDGVWQRHGVVEIEERHRAAPEALIPLCPVRQNLVIFLLPDRLMEFAADNGGPVEIRTLKRAADMDLGPFTGMCLASDDGLWTSCESGLARVAGPKRMIDSSSYWRSFKSAGSLQGLREPQCSDDDVVTCLAGRSGSPNASIVRFDGQSWKIDFQSQTNLAVAWTGPGGRLWSSTKDALFYETRGGLKAEEAVEGPIFDVAVGAHGIFWVATKKGLFCRVPEPLQEEIHAPTHLVTGGATSLVAQNGDHWSATEGGIEWQHDKVLREFARTDPTAPGAAVAFAELPDGKIWCAAGEKVWSFDGRNWTQIRSGLGKITAMIRGSTGDIWVASTQGLHRYNRGNWIEMGPEEGLAGIDVQNLREERPGRIYAGTTNAAVSFHPELDTDGPRTFLREPAEGGRNIPQGGSITLSFGARDKWNITTPERLLYSWRLDDREWSPFDSATSASFVDLPAGVHYFQVRAMDRSGNIDTQPARMEFGVILPWYKERRSVLIAGAGAAAALFFAGLAFKRHHELVLSYALVEKQVAQRTAELRVANQELLQSQKMKALGTLAAGIAHDFNNILSIIKGSTQIIEQNVNDPQKIRARAERIKTVVDQGSAVVQALLGFSRNSDEAVEACNVNTIVENTIRLLGDRFLRETAVRFEAGSEIAEARVSKGLVQQILLNFIFNAAESMGERKEVVIATRQSAALPKGVALSPARAAEYVCIAVRDSGSGIAPEILPRIFEPFFTTKAMSSRRGTGLGLSVAYELAQKMGAGLAVESTPGKGSVFTLILGAVPTPKEEPVETHTL